MAAQASIISSLPALAAALRNTGASTFTPAPTGALSGRALVPMYRIVDQTGERGLQEAVQTVEQVMDRLRRLAGAYGEWRAFDVGAYFDLTVMQAAHLVRVTERVSTVHVTFFVDLLLPIFRRAAAHWANHFVAAYTAHSVAVPALVPAAIFDDDFAVDTQPDMIGLWQQTQRLIDAVRATLSDDPVFLTMIATQAEQQRWRGFWQTAPAPGVDGSLLPALSSVPTLTLSFEFPLPAYRQSGRLRRLRASRARRRR